jgi:DNA-directed RNA polymerase specialized sigma24 family protein
MPESPRSSQSRPARFPATRWSLLAAAGGSPSEARAALEVLCQAYWLPVYAYIRRKGNSPHDSEDLSQQFFADLFLRWEFGRFLEESGHFRSYVLGALKRFLAKDYRKRTAWKRGGRETFVTVDREAGESWLENLGDEAAGPDKLFDKHWAYSVLERARIALEETYRKEGKAGNFEVLAAFLGGVEEVGAYAAAAERLEMSEAGARMAVFRMRKRYRQFVKEEIEQTVQVRDEVEPELEHLFAILRS